MTTGGFWGDHGGAREAKEGPRENYCSDTHVSRNQCRANKSRVTPSHPLPSPHQAPKHPDFQNSREVNGGTPLDHGRIAGRPLEFTGGAREDHGRIIGGAREDSGGSKQ
jgi:hypothetical protein